MNTELETRRGPAAAGSAGRRPVAAARRVLAPLLAASTLAACGYGRIHELDEQALEARSEIEIQLLRRAELVPTLVETAQRYAELESVLVGAVAEARAGLVAAVRSTDVVAMESASVSLSGALGELLAVVSAYSELQSDPGFQRLLVQLEGTQEQIEQAGRAYNEAVRIYNEYIGRFPQMLTAKVLGADPRLPYGTAQPAEAPSPADG